MSVCAMTAVGIECIFRRSRMNRTDFISGKCDLKTHVRAREERYRRIKRIESPRGAIEKRFFFFL